MTLSTLPISFADLLRFSIRAAFASTFSVALFAMVAPCSAFLAISFSVVAISSVDAATAFVFSVI